MECYVAPILSLGLYVKPLKNWFYPRQESRTMRNRIKIVWSRDMKADPESTVKDVASFVGLPLNDPELNTLTRAVDIKNDKSSYSHRSSGRFHFDTGVVYNTETNRGATYPAREMQKKSKQRPKRHQSKERWIPRREKLSLFYNASLQKLDYALENWYGLGTADKTKHAVPVEWYMPLQ